jgi:hypothetical protein
MGSFKMIECQDARIGMLDDIKHRCKFNQPQKSWGRYELNVC